MAAHRPSFVVTAEFLAVSGFSKSNIPRFLKSHGNALRYDDVVHVSHWEGSLIVNPCTGPSSSASATVVPVDNVANLIARSRSENAIETGDLLNTFFNDFLKTENNTTKALLEKSLERDDHRFLTTKKRYDSG